MTESQNKVGKKHLPTLTIATLMLMMFGNLGTSMAFSLQMSPWDCNLPNACAGSYEARILYFCHHWLEWLSNHWSVTSQTVLGCLRLVVVCHI